MSVTSPSDVYYDPYDSEIDTDPYPVWKRMRDEAPLYYNEKHDFWALTRYEDVEPALGDWNTYRSGEGTVLEFVKQGITFPPGAILFEDPPIHDLHRKLLIRVFSPRAMNALEEKVRGYCAHTLDPLVGADRFDFIEDLGAQMPMRTIGFLLGIPEEDQVALRDQIDDGLRLSADGTLSDYQRSGDFSPESFGDYVDWRAKHPSDDLMTQLLNAEFEDENGKVRKLTREQVVTVAFLLAGAGNETTTRLIGWTGKVLGENPDQLRELAADRSLIPNAIEELLRYEAPSPVQARKLSRDVTHHGQTVEAGQIMLLLNASANRDERRFPDADRFDIHRSARHLSFGYGIHHCLGAALARLEGRVALDEVLKRFPSWEVDWDNAVQARTSTVRGWEKLPVFIR
ncbi:cytochrome P450 [Frankia sp. AgPm24]|uniref:Cytochrome P450 n=1 Tax=Frankia umida TaxID=573489 RepID=A0ABT0JUV8_9ACTN|nr:MULTISPECIES: cytochrome P450 [Frankia]MCK9875332.1 cytochrome P450 [Frankia umida]MCK9923770.1 cytochrome P450 [Frankia sp. AgPm24]